MVIKYYFNLKATLRSNIDISFTLKWHYSYIGFVDMSYWNFAMAQTFMKEHNLNIFLNIKKQ